MSDITYPTLEDYDISMGGVALPVVASRVVCAEDAPTCSTWIVPIFELEMARNLWPDEGRLPSSMFEWSEYARKIDGWCATMAQEGLNVHFSVLSPLAMLDWAKVEGRDPSLIATRDEYLTNTMLPWGGNSSCTDHANGWQLEIIAAFMADRNKTQFDVVVDTAKRLVGELAAEVIKVGDGGGGLLLSTDASGFIVGGLSVGLGVGVDNGKLRLDTRYTANLILSYCKAAVFCRSIAVWRSKPGAERGKVWSWSLSAAGVRGNSADETRAIMESGRDMDRWRVDDERLVTYESAPSWLI